MAALRRSALAGPLASPVVVPMLAAAALAAAYLVWEPFSADLAAQTFRTDLWERDGFTVWSNAWYGGFHVPGYSLLFPPLASLLGPRLVGALAAVAAAGLFAAIAHEHAGERARLGALWFAAATATNLFTGRLTFALGVAVGLAALLAAQRRRAGAAGALGVATTLASPVAGLFAALAAAAVALAGPPPNRRSALAVAVGALAAIALTAWAFPTGGVEPFVASTLWLVITAVVLLLVLLPRDERALRTATWLYALLLLALFVVPNPVGGNATRLGALVAGPVLAVALGTRRPLALALAAIPLLYWQWVAPVRDVADAIDDPVVEAAFHAPLLAELGARSGADPVRVHVLATRNRWEAVHVAERHPIARGWLRQAESDDFELFQDGRLTAAAYRDWLDRRGISFVAVPDADLDYLADDEAALIRAGLPYLRPVWASGDWELYAVRNPAPLAGAGARLTSLGGDWFELRVPGPGEYPVRVRWSRYWRVAAGDGCVQADGDWTRAVARGAGILRVEASFSLGRLIRPPWWKGDC